ncbi:MAG: tetratricopeptide repeat protein [Phycisphaerales bacterium]
MGVRPGNRSKRTILALAILLFVIPASAAQESPASLLVPTEVELGPVARRAVDAGFLSEDERAERAIFHGVWDESHLTSPSRRAAAAFWTAKYFDPIFDDPATPVIWRAAALIERGEITEALRLLEDPETIRGHRLRAEALEWLGRSEEADSALDPILGGTADIDSDSVEERTQVARAMLQRARLRGEPASHYERVMSLLGDIHQRQDRLYWPAKLVEAELLFERDNPGAAAQAYHEVLQLNPRAAEAWYGLGRIALDQFDFDSATRAIDTLRELDADSVAATLLSAETWLLQNMPDEAERELESLLTRAPGHREAIALDAAVSAVRYDLDGALNRLDDFDDLSPGHPWGHYTVGYHLSRNRQYDDAARVLAEAIERQPTWSKPQVELGLMELQAGRDDEALRTLREVARLDPYNARAAFSLFLIEDLQTYDTLESDHFIVRFDPDTTDRVLAREMLQPLERIHREVTAAFSHELDRKTQIELMPNHERFAVRITGVPAIHTIAASTGPVIALESPQDGPGHFGNFDWKRVIRHEFVHTVTLSQTKNRIPHWFTEAAAVWQELAPRDYSKALQLAAAYREGGLFTLDEINWAFVRPKRPGDRGLAYAQGHWMFEFLIERFGRHAMIKLMEEYRMGLPEPVAIPSALGVSRSEFYEAFLEWAADEVRDWGLAPEPSFDAIVQRWRDEQGADADAGAPAITEDLIDRWLVKHPDHPDLLELKIAHAKSDPMGRVEFVSLLKRYMQARPVDPMPHRELARLAIDSDDPTAAIPYLERLDRWEQDTGAIGIELAKLYRADGRFDLALSRAERGVSVEPFNAAYRELAAAIAIQAKQYERARWHLEALTMLEPDRDHHRKRLDALNRLIERG